MANMETLVAMVKKAEAKAKEERCCKTIKTILAVIGIIVVIVAIAYAVYKFILCRKQDEDVCEECDCADEDSCIELEFTFPEEEEATEEDTITIVEQAEEETVAKEAE